MVKSAVQDTMKEEESKGVILPFLKAGRTLGVANASGGGRSEKKAKKNAEIETLVTEGSSSIAVGGPPATYIATGSTHHVMNFVQHTSNFTQYTRM